MKTVEEITRDIAAKYEVTGELRALLLEMGSTYRREDLDALKARMKGARPEWLLECAELAIDEYAHCIAVSILEGAGDPATGEKYHHLSYAYTQIIGAIMDSARTGERLNKR